MEDPGDPDDGPLLTQIGERGCVVAAQRRKALGYFFARTGVRLGILGAALASTAATFLLRPETFLQALLCNLAAGFLVFLAAAPVLRGVRRHQAAALAAGSLVIALILTAAYVSRPVLQSLLLNIGIGAALVLALDLNVARWLDAIARAQGVAARRLEQAAAKIESAESALDYKYVVHDFLNLPRPYRFGGISLADGEHMTAVAMFATAAADTPGVSSDPPEEGGSHHAT